MTGYLHFPSMSTGGTFVADHFTVYKREGDKLYESDNLKYANGTTLPPPGSILPEGIWNHLAFTFYVKDAPIKQLRCKRKVYKGALPVNTEDVVLGDFEPKDEPYTHHFADMETPSGWIVRGKFSCQLLFTDESKRELFKIKYPFQIVKAEKKK